MDISKYRNGKIYMITTENSNDIYIGSTIKTLKSRLTQHEIDFRNGVYCSSSEIIKQGDFKIVLIKDFDCNSLIELETEETKFQREMVCVNKRQARLMRDQINKTNIKWYEKNNCECGGTFTLKNKTQHNRTLKHTKYLKSKTKYIFKIKKH